MLESHTNIEGQWVGTLSGDNKAIVILNIEKGTEKTGSACVKQFDLDVPAFRVDLSFSMNDSSIKGVATNIQFFHPDLKQLVGVEQYRQYHPQLSQFTFSEQYGFEGKITGDRLDGVWNGQRQNKGDLTLVRTASQIAGSPDYKFPTWKEFRSYILDQQAATAQMFFRGQWDGKRKLRTSFHRHHRYEFARYLDQDFETLRHYINSISRHIYDLSRPDDAAALLGLAQHHGFPTPMLDWTRSPFVAAYFAFTPQDAQSQEGGLSRIFQFDHKAWAKTAYQSQHMLDPMPSISPRILPAHNNPRVVPQQSVMVFSNLDDIEAFIRMLEHLRNTKYLTVFEIPHTEREAALKELRLMGITSGSLFPDYEDVCRDLKSQLFS